MFSFQETLWYMVVMLGDALVMYMPVCSALDSSLSFFFVYMIARMSFWLISRRPRASTPLPQSRLWLPFAVRLSRSSITLRSDTYLCIYVRRWRELIFAPVYANMCMCVTIYRLLLSFGQSSPALRAYADICIYTYIYTCTLIHSRPSLPSVPMPSVLDPRTSMRPLHR